VTRVTVCCVTFVFLPFRFQLIFIESSQQSEILDDTRIASLHLIHNFSLNGGNFGLVGYAVGEPFQLSPQNIQCLERFSEFFVDFGWVSSHYLHRSFDIDDFPHAVGTENCIFFIGRADDARDMISPYFVELKGDTKSVSDDIEGRNVVIRRELAQLFLVTLLVVVIDNQTLEVQLFLDEVHREVVYLVSAFQHPLDGVQMHSELLLDVGEVGLLEVDVWPSETFEAPVGFKEVGFELFPEFDHVGAKRVESVFFVLSDLAEDLFGLPQHGVENKYLFLSKTLGK
jgi:hypothetical protein